MITETRGGRREQPSPLVPASRDGRSPLNDRSRSSDQKTRSQSREGGRRHPEDEGVRGRVGALGSGWTVEARRKGRSKLRRWGEEGGESRSPRRPRCELERVFLPLLLRASLLATERYGDELNENLYN